MYVCSHNQEVDVYVATHCEGALEIIVVNRLGVIHIFLTFLSV